MCGGLVGYTTHTGSTYNHVSRANSDYIVLWGVWKGRFFLGSARTSSTMRGCAVLVTSGAIAAAAALVVALRTLQSRWRRRHLALTYLDMPGKGEAIRYALALGGQPFEDQRLTVAELNVEREQGRLPFGHAPVLRVDGVAVAQSDAALRLAGRLAGRNLVPADPVHAALVDQWVVAETDFSYPFLIALYPEKCLLPDALWTVESSATFRLTLATRHIPAFLALLEEALEASPTDWIAGTSQPSIADLCWAPRLEWLQTGELDWLPRTILHPYPRVRALVARVCALPEIDRFRRAAAQV
jgi:glutathione S-transferase